MKITIETTEDGSTTIQYDRRKIQKYDIRVEMIRAATPVRTESWGAMERHATKGPVTVVLTIQGADRKKRKK